MALRVGIIGYGLSAKVFHIPFVRASKDLELYGIVERSTSECEKLSPPVKHFRSVEELVKDKAVDIVVVTSVNTVHFEHAKLALESGKHVIVEKPVTPTSSEAVKLIEIAERCGKILAVYQNRRFDGDFLTLSHLLSTKALGRLTSFVSNFDRHRPSTPNDPPNWRTLPAPGAGLLFDLGSHLADQVISLFGAPKAVGAIVGAQQQGILLGPGTQPPKDFVDDYFRLDLYYADAFVATLSATKLSRVPEQLRFRVLGDRGSYIKFDLDPQEPQLKEGMLGPGDEGFGVEDPAKYGVLTDDDDGTRPIQTLPGRYMTFYENLVGTIRGVDELAIKPQQVVTLLKVLELAQKSAQEGRILAFE